MSSEALRILRALPELTRRLAHPVSREALLPSMLHHAVAATGAEAGVARLLEHGGWLITTAEIGAPSQLEETHLRVPTDLPEVQFALEGSGPVLLQRAPDHPAFAALLPWKGSLVLSPLGTGNLSRGLLILAGLPRGELSELEFLTLRALGDLAAVGLYNEECYADLERSSRTDPLTGLGTRRHFEELFRRELARARRHHLPLCLAMVDIDRLKAINDRWGHPMGDRVIASVGRVLSDVRASDVTARFGGDEFVIVMPDTQLADAHRVCARIQNRLDALNDQRLFPFRIGLSIGVRQLSCELEDLHGEDLVAQADAEMYRTKRLRRSPVLRDEDEDEDLAAREPLGNPASR